MIRIGNALGAVALVAVVGLATSACGGGSSTASRKTPPQTSSQAHTVSLSQACAALRAKPKTSFDLPSTATQKRQFEAWGQGLLKLSGSASGSTRQMLAQNAAAAEYAAGAGADPIKAGADLDQGQLLINHRC